MKNIGINEEEKSYLNWLMHIRGIGKVTIAKLLKIYGTGKNLYESGENDWKRELTPRVYELLQNGQREIDNKKEYEILLKKQIHITALHLQDYPQRLKNIPDKPPILYYKGSLPEHDVPTVAIIGARTCSSYGTMVAEKFAASLTKEGIQIVSGLAMGIDGIGQYTACVNGGKTYSVLGCGVDICYPAVNKRLYDMIIEKKGGIISEYLPGTKPQPGLFPPRNRIISGLADVVLVIEAKEKSGTFITVDMALEQGKEVFAVPGRITDMLQNGCHQLIKQGAGIATSPEDIIEVLEQKFKIGMHSASSKEEKNIEKIKKLSLKEKEILKILDFTPKSIEDIWKEIPNIRADCSFLDVQEVMYYLVILCTKDIVKYHNAGYIKTNFFEF